MSQVAAVPKYVDTPPPGAGDLYEVVNGVVTEPPAMGVYETWVASTLNGRLSVFFESHGWNGWVVVETIFLIDAEANLQRRPDVAFVSYNRWPGDRPIPQTAAWDVIPDLAVEVVSPNDTSSEVTRRVDEYFRAGVRQVWVIDPRERRAHVYESASLARFLGPDDALNGADLLPGFKLRLADLLDPKGGAGPVAGG